MVLSLPLKDFLKTDGIILDVRSPAEYLHGKIPGAINLPLFTNEERALVGTTYKQVGKSAAVELGLKIVGPKLGSLITEAKRNVLNRTAKVHCWRGGMRSESVAWLLEKVGIPTVTLSHGYKTFRREVLTTLQNIHHNKPKLALIGGLTGSGKTQILHALRELGEQTLDLESLAHHRGSSFGMLMMPEQPSNEQFENSIAMEWSTYDFKKPIWIEAESRLIGKCKIPDCLFSLMKKAPLILVKKPFEERIQLLLEEYSMAKQEDLIQATLRISKRLGGVRSTCIVDNIRTGSFSTAAKHLLHYYDSTYTHSLSKCVPSFEIEASALSANEWAKKLLSLKILLFPLSSGD